MAKKKKRDERGSGAMPENGPAIVRRHHEREEFAEGSVGARTRWRNIGEHPLTMLHARNKLGCIDDEESPQTHDTRPRFDCPGCNRLAAGMEFRIAYEMMHGSGKDSTQPRIGGGMRPDLSEAQQNAGLIVAQIRAKLSRKNYLIVEALCGKGCAARDAILAAQIPFDNHLMPRLQEALDDLVDAVGSKRVRRAA